MKVYHVLSVEYVVLSQIPFHYIQTTWHNTLLCNHFLYFCISEPTFVSSSLDPAEGKLYFFFSEIGKEFSYIDELKTARVAQVCKVTENTERA